MGGELSSKPGEAGLPLGRGQARAEKQGRVPGGEWPRRSRHSEGGSKIRPGQARWFSNQNHKPWAHNRVSSSLSEPLTPIGVGNSQRPSKQRTPQTFQALRTRACYEQLWPRPASGHPTVGGFDCPKHEALALTLDSHCWKQWPLILLRGLGSSVSFL